MSMKPRPGLLFDGRTAVTSARTRKVPHGLYIEEMFTTGNDAANRAVFAEYGPEQAKVVGLALREKKKLVDKITQGARMHP